MKPDETSPVTPAAPASSRRVSLSPYVNGEFPNWEELFSAHDVAQLTRRPHYMGLSLALLGRFPCIRRFYNRGIGWLRSEVLRWLTRDPRTTHYRANPAPVARSRAAPPGLALEQTHLARTVCKNLGTCMDSSGSTGVDPLRSPHQIPFQIFARSAHR
jgi:hypothetical protein